MVATIKNKAPSYAQKLLKTETRPIWFLGLALEIYLLKEFDPQDRIQVSLPVLTISDLTALP